MRFWEPGRTGRPKTRAIPWRALLPGWGQHECRIGWNPSPEPIAGALADQIIESQRREIEEMKALIRDLETNRE